MYFFSKIEMLKKFTALFIFFTILINCDEIIDRNEDYFSSEILEKFAEYTPVEEYKQVCNYESMIITSDEETIKNKIISNSAPNTKNCVPDSKSFIAILENGWSNLSEFIIKDIYFPKLVDPSQIVISFINKSDSKLKSLVHYVNEYSESTDISPKFNFENFDDKITFNIVLPDGSYILEYISIFCYKDAFKINSVFKSKNKLFRINLSKQFYDLISGDCDYTFNSFNNQIEFSFKKMNKMKKWDKLFK